MTKVISISDEAYNTLKKMKASKSFSEIIIEITKEKSEDKFLSSIGSIDDETAERMLKSVKEFRKLKSRRFS